MGNGRMFFAELGPSSSNSAHIPGEIEEGSQSASRDITRAASDEEAKSEADSTELPHPHPQVSYGAYLRQPYAWMSSDKKYWMSSNIISLLQSKKDCRDY